MYALNKTFRGERRAFWVQIVDICKNGRFGHTNVKSVDVASDLESYTYLKNMFGMSVNSLSVPKESRNKVGTYFRIFCSPLWSERYIAFPNLIQRLRKCFVYVSENDIQEYRKLRLTEKTLFTIWSTLYSWGSSSWSSFWHCSTGQ